MIECNNCTPVDGVKESVNSKGRRGGLVIFGIILLYLLLFYPLSRGIYRFLPVIWAPNDFRHLLILKMGTVRFYLSICSIHTQFKKSSVENYPRWEKSTTDPVRRVPLQWSKMSPVKTFLLKMFQKVFYLFLHIYRFVLNTSVCLDS